MDPNMPFESHGRSGYDSNSGSPIVTSPYTPVSASSEHGFYDISGQPIPHYPLILPQESIQSPVYYDQSHLFSRSNPTFHPDPRLMNPGYIIPSDSLPNHPSSLSLQCVPSEPLYYYPDNVPHYTSPEPPFQQEEIESLERTFQSMKRVSGPQKMNHATTLKRSLQSIDAWFTERRNLDKKRKALALKTTAKPSKKGQDGKTPQPDLTPDPKQVENKEKAQRSLARFLRGVTPPAGPPPTLAVPPTTPYALQIPTQRIPTQQILNPNGMGNGYVATGNPQSLMLPVSLPRTPEAVEQTDQHGHNNVPSPDHGWLWV